MKDFLQNSISTISLSTCQCKPFQITKPSQQEALMCA